MKDSREKEVERIRLIGNKGPRSFLLIESHQQAIHKVIGNPLQGHASVLPARSTKRILAIGMTAGSVPVDISWKGFWQWLFWFLADFVLPEYKFYDCRSLSIADSLLQSICRSGTSTRSIWLKIEVWVKSDVTVKLKNSQDVCLCLRRDVWSRNFGRDAQRRSSLK